MISYMYMIAQCHVHDCTVMSTSVARLTDSYSHVTSVARLMIATVMSTSVARLMIATVM